MNDLSTATLRTTLPVFYLAAVSALIFRFTGWTVTVDQLAPWSPAIAFVFGAVYRVARELEARWPWIGRIIFGSAKTPAYIDTTAAED